MILYFGTEKRHYAFFITSVLFFAKLIVGVLETYPKIMPYIWLDLTAGVVLVITGMILFYLRKGTEKAIKKWANINWMFLDPLEVDMLRLGKYI